MGNTYSSQVDSIDADKINEIKEIKETIQEENIQESPVHVIKHGDCPRMDSESLAARTKDHQKKRIECELTQFGYLPKENRVPTYDEYLRFIKIATMEEHMCQDCLAKKKERIAQRKEELQALQIEHKRMPRSTLGRGKYQGYTSKERKNIKSLTNRFKEEHDYSPDKVVELPVPHPDAWSNWCERHRYDYY